jgi:ribosomal protein L14E/L6E/L27E
MKIGDIVIPLTGKFAGERCIIDNIEQGKAIILNQLRPGEVDVIGENDLRMA